LFASSLLSNFDRHNFYYLLGIYEKKNSLNAR
jgi:hypothetical protein